MARINLTKIKRHLVGMVVPKQLHGNIGQIVEQEIEKMGYVINKRKGTDLNGIEVKTRGVDASSAQTVAKMSKTTIIKTPFSKSIVKEKSQHQLRVKHKVNPLTDDNIIVSADEVDFTDKEIQQELKESYEKGRKVIAQYVKKDIDPPNYIRPDDCSCYWERTDKKSSTWEFRIPPSTMARFENIAKVNDNPLFVVA
jgi:hypothetical protein